MAAGQTLADALGLKQPGNELLRFLGEAAYLWSCRGQLEKAAEIFQAITILAPNDPVGFIGLAECHLTQRRYREADKSAEAAIRTSGIDRRTTAFAYKLRGKALMQLNRLKDAQKALQRAAEIDPGGAEGKTAEQLLDLSKKLGIFPGDAGAAAKG
jgi:tetratricopeptide (TPR) repeat protein